MLLIVKREQLSGMKIRDFTLILFFGTILAVGQLATQTPSDPSRIGFPPYGFGKPDIAQMFTRALSLTDSQKAQVQALADSIQSQLDATREQAREPESALIAQLNNQIRPLLTADQQTKLDALQTFHGKGGRPQ